MENQSTENTTPSQIENTPPAKLEEKPHNKNLPLIIVAILAAIAVIATIVIVLIFANKSETPEQPIDEVKEVNSYVILRDDDYRDSLIEDIVAIKVITDYSDLQSLYDVIGAHYATSYPIPVDDTDYYNATDCLSESGDVDCEGTVAPVYKNPLDKPQELDEDFFNDHDLIVTYFENYWCGGGFNRVRNVEKNGDFVTIEIGYDGSCGACAAELSIILIEVEKDVVSITDEFNIKEVEENHPTCDPNMAYKPMIYLYPEEETKINVKLGRPELLTTTYPKYNENTGWQVVAKPDGTLKYNNREYYGLYWEGLDNFEQQKDGFVISGKDTAKFLEEKLEILGLNEREANEFIIYWLPKMGNNEYNYVRFVTGSEIEEWMPLEVSPKPDTTIRILMEFKPLDQKIDIEEQRLEQVKREGYTVVEWGGTEIK